MPIQILIVLFALFALYKAWRAYGLGQLDKRKLVIWSFFWIVGIVVILRPEVTSRVAAWVGIGRGVDLILYLSVIILFYGLFQLSRKIDKLESSLTKLVRELASRDPKNKDE